MATRIQNVCTFIKLGALAIIAIGGIVQLCTGIHAPNSFFTGACAPHCCTDIPTTSFLPEYNSHSSRLSFLFSVFRNCWTSQWFFKPAFPENHSVFPYTRHLFARGGLLGTSKLRPPLLRTQSYQLFLIKLGGGRDIASHASLAAMKSAFLTSAFSLHSPSFSNRE